MVVVVILAVLVVCGLFMLRGTGEGDAPARIVTAATNRLPAYRRDWGRAMVAELAQVHSPASRWRFTASVLRVVLFPPVRHRTRMVVVAVSGLLIAAAATVTTAREIPSLSVFVAVLGLLLGGYATVVTSRTPRPRRRASHVIVGAVALAGTAGAVTAIIRIGAAHPGATATGDTRVFSVLFALILTGYLAFALTPPRLGIATNTVLWWALTGALASGAAGILAALTTPVNVNSSIPLLLPVAATATLVTSIGASATTGSSPAGARAGLLTAILSAPMQFTINMTVLLQQHRYTLTDPYDIAAFPHSGYPDVASYLLSHAIGGEILSGLVIRLIAMLAIALLGAAVGSGLHHLATRHTARNTT
ncbi:MAG: hypothetical protein ACRDS0_04835 [Pseudonocardiaceae bacterium]